MTVWASGFRQDYLGVAATGAGVAGLGLLMARPGAWRPKCGPSSKPCGDVCIPQENTCKIDNPTDDQSRKAANRYRNTKIARAALAGTAVIGGTALAATALKGRAVNKQLDKAWEELHRKEAASREASAQFWRDLRDRHNMGGPGFDPFDPPRGAGSAADPAARAARKREFLQTIGADPNASEAEAKRLWRRWVKQNHPDKGGDPEVFRKAGSFKGFHGDSAMSVWAQGFEFEGDRFDEDCPPGQNCKKRKWGLNTPGKILGAVGAASLATSGIAYAMRRKGGGSVKPRVNQPSLKSPGSVRTRSPFTAKAPQRPGVVRKRNTRVSPKNMGAGDIKRSLNNPNQTWEI